MKKDKLKLDRFTEITAENFDEFEKVVYEYERWNKKERAVWGILQPVSDLVFFFLMLSGTYMIADRLELPVFSALRPIAEIWGGAGPGSPLVTALACIVTVMLFSFVFSFVLHAVLAAVLKLAWPCKTLAPVQGSGLERVEALQKHFESNCKPLPVPWTVVGMFAYPVVAFLPLLLDKGWNQIQMNETGVLFHVVGMILTFAVFAVVYIAPYGIHFFFCLLFYKTTNGTGEAGNKLAQYVFHHQWEKEKREEAEKKEQDRLRGDKLYRQATAEGRMDEELIAEAAELGSSPACLYMGRRLLEAWYEGQYTTSYTKTELEEMAELGWDYFLTAGTGEISPESEGEAELGYLVFKEAKERLNMSMYEWSEILKQLRRLKTSGKLPKRYEDIYDFAVEKAVDRIDMIAEYQRWSGVHTSDSGGGPSSCSTMHDDLDAVERSLGGPGWSDGV